MHVFQSDQREVTLKSTQSINDYFHYLSTEEDSNRLINMERSAEVLNEVLQLHKQETPDCAVYLHGIWLLKKGVAWGPEWQCGARFVGMCQSGITCTRR